MSLSIRNQIPGTVTSVTEGAVMALVKLELAEGQEITAAVTADAVKELGIAPGIRARALVKSTEVALATGLVSGLSIRNRLQGVVTGIVIGGAMAGVRVSVNGAELTSAITADAAAELGLAPGSQVVALIKSTEVSLEVS